MQISHFLQIVPTKVTNDRALVTSLRPEAITWCVYLVCCQDDTSDALSPVWAKFTRSWLSVWSGGCVVVIVVIVVVAAAVVIVVTAGGTVVVSGIKMAHLFTD